MPSRAKESVEGVSILVQVTCGTEQLLSRINPLYEAFQHYALPGDIMIQYY